MLNDSGDGFAVVSGCGVSLLLIVLGIITWNDTGLLGKCFIWGFALLFGSIGVMAIKEL